MASKHQSKRELDRRSFMRHSAVAAGLAAGAVVSTRVEKAHAADRKIVKSLKFGMIASKDGDGNPLSIDERFKIAVDAGFESVEPDTIFDAAQLKEYEAASAKHKLPVDAIICSTHWRHPLSDPDEAVWQKTMDGMRTSMQNVKDLGGDMVLLVPAVVNPNVQYGDAWTRSVERIKRLTDDAERAGVTIGIENVWNKFLLSPLEAKEYIAEIGSDRVKFWFDVGNVVLFGYPQDWIRTLRDDIVRVDLKDFDAGKKEFVPLLDGSVDWPEVMRAFDEIGYEGVFAAEVRGGDLAYLTEYVSERMDTIIAG